MPSQVDTYIGGLNSLLRDLGQLDKMATKELRTASRVIADRHMVPAYRKAALQVPTWGDYLAKSVRSRNDRLPSVKIGYQKKVLSGGASSNMLRYPTDTGIPRGARDLTGVNPFQKTNWIGKAKTYTKPALTEWGQAVDRVVRKWNVT
jgi:hypothetical protein